MAERTSTRASSRRTTPQPAPQSVRVGTQSPQKRITRSLRSRSRDLSESEGGRTGLNARRGAKQVTPDGKNGAVGQSGLKSRKGRPAKYARIEQDLSIVAEDPRVVSPDLETSEGGDVEENVDDAGADQRSTQNNHKSPGGLSAFSGTTARISLSAHEPTEPNPENMLDTLPDLSHASDKFLSFVLPAELSEASTARTMARLQDNNTRENKKLKRLGDTFERQRKEYGGDSFISVGETLKILLGRKAGPINEQTASWRPDALLQKANLAILVSRILSIRGQDETEQFLEDIARTFPQPFAQRLGHPENLKPECSALAEATFQLALEVRTQEAIMLLARYIGKPNFDQDTALLQLFYDASDLKGWAVSGLRTADLTRQAKDTILGRVVLLRESIRQFSRVESLRARFPWSSFAQHMVAWAHQRLTEVEIQTATYGGAKAICQGLTDVIQSGRLRQTIESEDADSESEGLELRLEFDSPSESRATSEQQDSSTGPARADKLILTQFSANSKKARCSAAHLKQRRADREVLKAAQQTLLPQNEENAPDVQVASTAGPSMRALTPQRNFNAQVIPAPPDFANGLAPSADQDKNWSPEDNEEESRYTDDKRGAHASIAYRKQREAESNKENVAEIPESQHTKTKKRSFYDRDPLAERVSDIDKQDSNGEEGEISSDEGFQCQPESSNAAIQRRFKSATKRPVIEPARLQGPSPKKVRVQENTDARTLNGSANVVGDEQVAEVSPTQTYEEYVRTNQSAKQMMAVVKKPPQRRSAWTAVETDVLHNLITEHGTSWKLLKDKDFEQGHLLEARDQVALKDKARNMKMDFLKAGRVLPNNFDRIPLSQLQIRRLRDGGIDYDPETGTRFDAEVIEF